MNLFIESSNKENKTKTFTMHGHGYLYTGTFFKRNFEVTYKTCLIQDL